MKLFMFDDCPGEDYSVLCDASSTNVRFYKIPKSALNNSISLPRATVAAYDVVDEYISEIPHDVFDSYKIKNIYNERVLRVKEKEIKIYPSGYWTDVFLKNGMYWFNGKPFGVVVANDHNDDVYVPQYILENLNLIPITEKMILKKSYKNI